MLNSVAADKAVRDQAQMEAQRVAMAGSALSLNREVYDALVAMDLTDASPATRHFVERTLLGYRLAGVDKDKETRDRIQALHEKATMASLEFSRNIQEGGKTIVATQAELDGLPPDYLGRHQPDASGQITLTTDQPDMQPVMTFASNGDLRERMFLAYNTRAYPANKQILLDLLVDAAGDCVGAGLSQLGRPGDRGPDDGLGGECADVSGEAGRGEPGWGGP